jgi:hypothetical protein
LLLVAAVEAAQVAVEAEAPVGTELQQDLHL